MSGAGSMEVNGMYERSVLGGAVAEVCLPAVFSFNFFFLVFFTVHAEHRKQEIHYRTHLDREWSQKMVDFPNQSRRNQF